MLTHRAVGVGVVERRLHPFETEGELAPYEDEHLRDLEGVGGDEHAFDELMGIALDEQMVRSGRFALVPVDHQIGDGVLAQHGPLATGRKPGSAPPQQAGHVHLVDSFFGGEG